MKESDGDERLTPINLLICLVARYFGQSDLSDASWRLACATYSLDVCWVLL